MRSMERASHRSKSVERACCLPLACMTTAFHTPGLAAGRLPVLPQAARSARPREFQESAVAYRSRIDVGVVGEAGRARWRGRRARVRVSCRTSWATLGYPNVEPSVAYAQ